MCLRDTKHIEEYCVDAYKAVRITAFQYGAALVSQDWEIGKCYDAKQCNPRNGCGVEQLTYIPKFHAFVFESHAKRWIKDCLLICDNCAIVKVRLFGNIICGVTEYGLLGIAGDRMEILA